MARSITMPQVTPSNEHSTTTTAQNIGCGCCLHCACTGLCRREQAWTNAMPKEVVNPLERKTMDEADDGISVERHLLNAIKTVPHPQDTIGMNKDNLNYFRVDDSSGSGKNNAGAEFGQDQAHQSSVSRFVRSPSPMSQLKPRKTFASLTEASKKYVKAPKTRPSSPVASRLENSRLPSQSSALSSLGEGLKSLDLSPQTTSSISTSISSLESMGSHDPSFRKVSSQSHLRYGIEASRKERGLQKQVSEREDKDRRCHHHRQRHGHGHERQLADHSLADSGLLSTPNLGTFHQPRSRDSTKKETSTPKLGADHLSVRDRASSRLKQSKSVANLSAPKHQIGSNQQSRIQGPDDFRRSPSPVPPPVGPLPTLPAHGSSGLGHVYNTTSISLGPLKLTRTRSSTGGTAETSTNAYPTTLSQTKSREGNMLSMTSIDSSRKPAQQQECEKGTRPKLERIKTDPVSNKGEPYTRKEKNPNLVSEIGPGAKIGIPLAKSLTDPESKMLAANRQPCDYGSLYAVKKYTVQHAPPHMPNTLHFLDWSLRNDNNEPLVAYRIQAIESRSSHMSGFEPKSIYNDWLVDSHENGAKLRGKLVLAAGVNGPPLFEIDVKRRHVDRFIIRGTKSHLPAFRHDLHHGDHKDYRHVYCSTPNGELLKWHLEDHDKLMRLIGRGERNYGSVYGEARVQKRQGHSHNKKSNPSSQVSHYANYDKKHGHVSKDTQLFFYNPSVSFNADQGAAFKGEDPHMDYGYLCATWWCARQTFDESVVVAAHAESELIENIERGPFEIDLLGGV